MVKCSNANKSYQLQYCNQKLSLATCAHKIYRTLDAILRFFSVSADIILIISLQVLIQLKVNIVIRVTNSSGKCKNDGFQVSDISEVFISKGH